MPSSLMAQSAPFPSCVHLHFRRSCIGPSSSMSQNVYLQSGRRKHSDGKHSVFLYPSTLPVSTMHSRRHPKKFHLRCFCLGAFVDAENAAPWGWVPVVDQVLLMTTVAFAYMAGVNPSKTVHLNTRKSFPDQVADDTNFTSSGRSSENQNNFYAWHEVKRKLLDALEVTEQDASFLSQAIEHENKSIKKPLSLDAISEGPRLRLLWATLQQLWKEVDNIADTYGLNGDNWLVVTTKTIRGSVQPICLRWLEEELQLEHKEYDKAFLARIFKWAIEDDTILQSIKNAGKEDLYADLLFFLRFGSFRSSCHYGSKLLIRHGVEILEDLVISLADGITKLYLELVSVDSNMSNEMGHLDLVLCPLSSRSLQKLRNEVALNQWLHQNIESVISMYEDRFDLFAFQTNVLEGSNNKEVEKYSWWRRIALHMPGAKATKSQSIFIRQISMAVKRTKDLRTLSGWRYYFSLYLELSDITMPLLRAIIAKVSNAVSFFLVSLIGRSLGLVYTGIRQALGLKRH